MRITVGDLHFSARWEPAAPPTIEAIRRMLPIDSQADPLPLVGRIHLDPVWRLPARHRLREPHLAPRARHPRDVPRRHQRVRDLLPVRRLHDRVQGRTARREPVRHDRARRGLGTTACARSAGGASGRAPSRSGSSEIEGDRWMAARSRCSSRSSWSSCLPGTRGVAGARCAVRMARPAPGRLTRGPVTVAATRPHRAVRNGPHEPRSLAANECTVKDLHASPIGADRDDQGPFGPYSRCGVRCG